jgi:hypothetical protein
MQRRSLPAIAAYVVLLFACAMPLWSFVHPIMPGQNPDESGFMRAMAVWALLPYGGLFVAGRRFASEARPSSVILMGALLIGLPSVLAFLDTLEAPSTGQSYADMGVGFFLMLWPVAAWVVVGLTTWVAKLVSQRTSRSADVSGAR